MKLYPSSFTPMQGATTNANFKEGCLRYIAVKDRLTTRTEIPQLYQTIGHLAEERVDSMWAADAFVSREVPFQLDLGDDVIISGRADFVTPNSVVESKASISPTKRAMWRRGQYSVEHLGQLVLYMLALDRPIGLLKCSYVHLTKDASWLGFEDFEWSIYRKDNAILVQGAEIDLTVQDVLGYFAAAKHALIGTDLPPRPTTTNPCRICPFQAVCDSNPQDRETFVRQVQSKIDMGIEPVGGNVPKLKMHDRAGVKV
jgi:hypothetical protein